MSSASDRRELVSRVRAALPQGGQLPEQAWQSRHVGVIVLLWLHSAAIPVFALVRGFPAAHALLEGAIVPATALAAMAPQLSRRTRTAAASLGLLSSSAVLVHLSGGVIEMHFHFFVMVAVVALYQDWVPFLTAIGYVFVHHGLLGALDPDSVFNHYAAQNHPWRWAGVHALFIAGISAACLVYWRVTERALSEQKFAEDRLREETRIVESLHEFGKALNSELDTTRVVQQVTDAATALTCAAFGAFFYNVVGASGESYLLYTLSGAAPEDFADFGLPRNTPLFAPTFSGEGVVRLDDVTADSRFGQMAPHHGMPRGHLPVRSYLAVPVKSRDGNVLGGLFFGHSEPAQFTDTSERIVVGIAAQAAIALDNARLYESELAARTAAESASARLAVLAEASRILTSSLEEEGVLRALCELVTRTISDRCVIDLVVDGSSMRRVVSRRSPETGLEEVGVSIVEVDQHSAGPATIAIRTGQAQLVEEHSDAFPAIVVPLVGRQGVMGALTLSATSHSTESEPLWDVHVAEELALRAALAIENARLYSRQRSVAETLQHSLLPERLPELPGVEMAARYRAGGLGVEVGGDWYDVIQLTNGRLAIAIGDVVGRGEQAASLMGQLRNALRAYTLDGKEPAETVKGLNALLLDLGGDHMATAVLAVLDPEAGSVRYVNAGHPPPLLVRSAAGAAFLDGAGGLPLGALAGARYEEVEIALEPGDAVMLYTDGLVENRNSSLDEGMQCLHDSVAEGGRDIEALCDRAVEASIAMVDADDDAAILAIRLLPLGPEVSFRLPATPSILGPLRAALRRWLSPVVSADEMFPILLACGEACANTIRHGSAPGGHFNLEGRIDDDISVVIRDHGRWKAPRRTGGGRGLSIIERCADELEVVPGEDGTEVRMRWHLEGAVRPLIR